MKKIKVLCMTFLIIAFGIRADEVMSYRKNTEERNEMNNLELELPIYEFPYNYESKNKFPYESPSMNQALDLTKSYTLGMIYLTDEYVNSKYEEDKWKKLKSGLTHWGIYSLNSWFPFGEIWLHEEYHRAVLNKNNIDSYNGLYDFDFFASAVSVSRLNDEDLIRLKKENPQDMIRLHMAGYEGQSELSETLKKEYFFKELNEHHLGINVYRLIPLAGNTLYLNFSASEEADTETDIMNKEEGKDISKRDFTGFDFTAWVYDLFRPDEAYEDRGIHPSGVGIDRYIKYSDLTEEEQKFLKKQVDLSLLSFIELDLFRKESIKIGEDSKFTFNLKHHLTPFGYSINTNLLFKKDKLNIYSTLLSYSNYERNYFGVDLQLIDYPLEGFDNRLVLNGRLSLWEQPEDLLFKTEKGEVGGLVGIGVKYRLNNNWSANFGVEGKSKGWVASNVYLEENITSSLSLSYYID